MLLLLFVGLLLFLGLYYWRENRRVTWLCVLVAVGLLAWIGGG